jgi:glycosyltransferase involved in cell wall biosynthesis
MANLLVLGVGPLPFEHGERLHAPGIRTWQLATALAANHHFITLCIIDFGDFHPDHKAAPPPAIRQDAGSNISLVKLAYHPTQSVQSIRTLHLATRFAAVVSSSDIMNGIAADLNLPIPMWLDYNGDPFAEKQLQARLYKHDGSLLPQWELYLKGLACGDRFSVCSQPQRHALIGQLGFAGRLTAETSGEEMVQVLPNCSRIMSERTPKRTTPLKGKQIPATAFLVLWTGGYNTWSDPETLFHGLERAMQENDSIYFATTGGAIDGHDNKSFQIFSDLVEQSPLRDRFVFLGWIPTDEVGSYYEQADLAVFTDRYSVEGELGARTRIVDWIQFNLPIACTNLCELTNQLESENLIKTFPIGDAAAMAKVITEAAADSAPMLEMAISARQWLDRNLDERTVLAPLLAWAAAPEFAGDKKVRSKSGGAAGAEYSALTRLLLDNFKQSGLAAAGGGAVKPKAKSDAAPAASLSSRLKGLFKR